MTTLTREVYNALGLFPDQYRALTSRNSNTNQSFTVTHIHTHWFVRMDNPTLTLGMFANHDQAVQVATILSMHMHIQSHP